MTRFEEAERIRASSRRYSEGEGRRIVNLLLEGRGTENLAKDELELLCVGYNWAMDDRRAYEMSLLAINKYWSDVSVLKRHTIYVSNYLSDPMKVVNEYKGYVSRGIGPRTLWWLYIADELLCLAYFSVEDEDQDWHEGMEVLSDHYLRESGKYLELAVGDEPSLLVERSYLDNDIPWNTRYAPLLWHSAYKHLTRSNA